MFDVASLSGVKIIRNSHYICAMLTRILVSLLFFKLRLNNKTRWAGTTNHLYEKIIIINCNIPDIYKTCIFTFMMMSGPFTLIQVYFGHGKRRPNWRCNWYPFPNGFIGNLSTWQDWQRLRLSRNTFLSIPPKGVSWNGEVWLWWPHITEPKPYQLRLSHTLEWRNGSNGNEKNAKQKITLSTTFPIPFPPSTLFQYDMGTTST